MGLTRCEGAWWHLKVLKPIKQPRPLTLRKPLLPGSNKGNGTTP
jgi:hypothetical protein